MKMAVLALVAVMVLGGGAAGAYFYFGHPAEASIGATDEHKDAKEAHKEKDKSHHKFVELDPLVLPIVDENGLSQTVSIVVMIEVDGDKNAAIVNQLQPRLKDAYIQELYGVLNRHVALKEDGVIEVGAVKDRLGKISEKVLGEGVIEEVLLQVVTQRPI